MFHPELSKNAVGVVCLVHADAGRVAFELDAKIPLNGSKIFSLESLVQVILELVDQPKTASCKEDVVYIDQQGDCMGTEMCKIQIGVQVGLQALPREQSSMEPSVPSSWALLEAIERFVRFAD